MHKSSGNKVHCNTAGLSTAESGRLSRRGGIVQPLEEEDMELSQVGPLPGNWDLGQAWRESSLGLALPGESSRGTLCPRSWVFKSSAGL